MKQVKLKIAALTLIVAGLFAFNHIKTGTIKGMVLPAEAATNAWAISTTDTLKASVNDGNFMITGAAFL